MDVIGAHQAGFTNVVASLGTALTERQLGLLKRLTNRYALALDPDAAGEEATKRGLQVAREALARKTVPVPMGAGLIGFEERLEAELPVIPMPPCKDPDELIHDDPQKWIELTAHPEPLVDFYFHALTQDLNLNNARDKSIAVQRLVPIIREVGDAVQRAHYTQQLARLVQVAEQTIAQEIAQKKRAAQPEKRPVAETPAAAPKPVSKREEYFLMLALRTPEHLPRVAFLQAEDFADGETRAFYLALREFGESAEFFEREAFRAVLDVSLLPLFDRLTEVEPSEFDLNEPDLARETEIAAYRLRAERYKTELVRLEVLLRDQGEVHDAENERNLFERVNVLRKRVSENQKALSARTALKAHII